MLSHGRRAAELESEGIRTHTVSGAGRYASQEYMPSRIGGTGSARELLAEEKLRKRAESESVSPSGPSTTTDPTGPSSSTSAER